MHFPTASQISCSITMSLGESGKLCNTSNVQSRNGTVNGIFQICVCALMCVSVCAECEHRFFGFVICRDGEEASPAYA